MEPELQSRGAIIQFMYLMFERPKTYGLERAQIPHQGDSKQYSAEN